MATTLASILQIPNEDDPIPENVSQADIFNFLTQSNTANRSTPSVKYQVLPDEFKVLRHILSYIILPKMGSRDVVTVVESRIMYKIIKGLKVSLPMLMVEHMEQASGSRVNLTLPYAPWLTKIFKHCEVSLGNEKEEEPEGVIGKDLLRRMHVDLEGARARFEVEWERRSKHRNGGGAPGGADAGGAAHVVDSEETSTDGDVDAFIRVDREAPPQGEERAPEARVPSPPRVDPWPQPTSEPPPSAPFPHPDIQADRFSFPPTATSSNSDLAIILREIRQLSYGFRTLSRRFDNFENQCINRFDHFEEELGALRLQVRFPTSPIHTHASYRPERARAASSGSNEPVHISSSSDHPSHATSAPPVDPPLAEPAPPVDQPAPHSDHVSVALSEPTASPQPPADLPPPAPHAPPLLRICWH